MLSFSLQTPDEVAAALAERVRARRVERNWTQAELAERADVSLSTLQRFEQTGRIAVRRLLKIAVVLDAIEDFEALFEAPEASSLDELEGREQERRRARRRRRDDG